MIVVNARSAAVNENKIRQQYKNRLNNAQGQHFEREILAGCRMYESHGIASIDKTPEPFRVTSKNHRTGEFTGRFFLYSVECMARYERNVRQAVPKAG